MFLAFVFMAGCLEESAGQDSKNVTAGENGTSGENGTVEGNAEGLEENQKAVNSATGHLKTEAVNFSGLEAGNSTLLESYELEALDVKLKVPQYGLPLEESEISNYEAFLNRVPMDDAALEMLMQNGFVVIENPYNPREDDITRMYKWLPGNGPLIFITPDTLLHIYHVQFDESMSEVEQRELYDLVWELDTALLKASVRDYKSSSGETKVAARKNAAYFAVALSLLQPGPGQIKDVKDPYSPDAGKYFPPDAEEQYRFEVPEFVEDEVEAEIALIEAHEGYALSPIFLYDEDYSQYVPRGHYTRSAMLENYFRAFMWHGRMSMLLKGRLIQASDPEKVARIQTIQASLISSELEADPELLEKWDRIYAVTAFYVGLSDDLGPYEYMEAMDDVFGSGEREFNETAVEELKIELAGYHSPEIYGGTGGYPGELITTAEQADELLEDTKGFRFMGQRFIPDSYMFSRLTGPYTEEYTGNRDPKPFTYILSSAGNDRGFPRGLDVMALLGSERAVYWLDELDDSNYENYSYRYGELESEFSDFDAAAWNRNLYWSWLYSLQPLLKTHGDGYPTFMQTEAWQDRELSTSLASWTELRHDTILYAKQSYIVEEECLMIPDEKPVGFVEPVPEFYNRLLALTKMSSGGLEELDVLDENSKRRFESLEEILEKLVDISEKELENQELSEEEKLFIVEFGDELNLVGEATKDAKKTTLVADVHTEPNTGMVLEEGTGYVNMLVVAYKVPDGRIFLAAGPVMSHYEFKQPMDDRLTDEKWREMLKENPPERPEWTSTYIS